MNHRMLVIAKKIVSEMKDFYHVNEPIKVEKSDIETIEWLIKQVEKYREALEFYADEETYETKFATDTDEIYDPFTLIELDEGKKARKALESDNE